MSLLKHFSPFFWFFFAITCSLFTVQPSISNIALSSHAIFSICSSPIFFLPHHSLPPTHPLLPPSLLSPLPPSFSSIPSHPLPFPFSLSLPLCAQDRSSLITLMAMMIQLNGALSPRCLSKAFLCSLLMRQQQHSAVTEASALSLCGHNDRMNHFKTVLHLFGVGLK